MKSLKKGCFLQNQKSSSQDSFKNQKEEFSSKENLNPSSALDQFVDSLFQMIVGVEEYVSPFRRNEPYPPYEAEKLTDELIKNAAFKTASISATCALPGGFAGFLTILPELIMIFRIQGYLVKDIASIYGKEAQLTKELLLFSLFKNGGAHLFRKFVEETSVRILIRPTTVRAFQGFLKSIGLTVTRRIIRKNLTRWIPLAGAALTGGFTYFDTMSVGKNAKELFSKDIIIYPLLNDKSNNNLITKQEEAPENSNNNTIQ